MEILKTNRLDQRQTQQIVALENKCFIRDGLENHAYLTNDLNFDPQMPCFFLCYEGDALVAFLTAFAPERAQAEIIAVTDPAWERKGLFHKLYAEACAAVQSVGISEVLFAVERKSVSGNKLVKSFTDQPADHSEYRMQLPFTSAAIGRLADRGCAERVSEKTKHVFGGIESEANGRPEEEAYLNTIVTSEQRKGYLYIWENEYAGTFVIGREENGVFIYGVAMSEKYRGKGIAKYMMKQAIALAEKEGTDEVFLEVDSQNPAALNLYKSCGFKAVFAVDYYRLPQHIVAMSSTH